MCVCCGESIRVRGNATGAKRANHSAALMRLAVLSAGAFISSPFELTMEMMSALAVDATTTHSLRRRKRIFRQTKCSMK